MKSAYELLIDAPESQVTRLKIVFKEIADGRCADAAFTLRNAAREEYGDWSRDASNLADHLSEIGA